MITREQIKKLGWEATSHNRDVYQMGDNRLHVLFPVEDPYNPEYLIERFAGATGARWEYDTLFRGKLSVVMELEYIMHWAGIL